MAKPKRLPVQRQVSAGGIVYRRHNGKVGVLLCGRNKERFILSPRRSS